MRQAMFRSLAEPKKKHWTVFYIYTDIALAPSLIHTRTHTQTHIHRNTLYFITNNDNGNPNRILVAQALDNSFHFGWTRRAARERERERKRQREIESSICMDVYKCM